MKNRANRAFFSTSPRPQKLALTLIFLAVSIFSNAQKPDGKTVERKGFVFGASVGASEIRLSAPGLQDGFRAGGSLPNMKFGFMATPKTAVLLCLPGTVYSHGWSGRKRDRGFEGIVPSVQYWAGDRFWLLGGAGLGMDAPAFYDIKDASERKFQFGGAALAGAGLEFWRRGQTALDLQGRVHYGNVKSGDGRLEGLAFSLLVGVNFY